MRFFFIYFIIAILVLVGFFGFYAVTYVLTKNNLLLNYALHLVLVGSVLSQNSKRLISKSLTQHFGSTLRTVLGVFIGQRLVMEGFTALVAPLSWWQHWVENYNSIFQQLPPAELLSLILVLGPVREEVFFRWMYTGLTRKHQTSNPYLMILFSSLTFTFIHHPVAWLNAFIWGWALMLFYLKTQSVVFVIVLHSLANALAYVFPLNSRLQSDTPLLGMFLNLLWLTTGFLLVFFSLKSLFKTIT